jgi:TRAP-type C4-dicarboxylate transport system permease large subunit
MIILGLLLILGTAGLIFLAFNANESVFTAPAGTIDILGRQADLTIGQVFIGGAVIGAVLLVSIVMLFTGMGHRARRSAATRRELNQLRRAETPKVVEREKEPAIR